MIDIGWFSELKCNSNNGSIKEHINNNIKYDKNKVVDYLSDESKRIAGCPRAAIDCITGEKISDSFSVFSDGEYCWGDFLIYHIKKYNIKLPKKLINKASAN